MPSGNGRSLLAKIISGQDLAQLIGRTTRQVRNLAREGVIELAKDKAGRVLSGRYVLGPTILKLFERERELHTAKDPSIARFRRARAEREEHDAEMAEIELGYHRQKYLLASVVEEQAIRMLTACRSRMLAIPSAISRSLIALTDADRLSESQRFREIYQRVEAPIHEALREISELPTAGREAGRRMQQWEDDYAKIEAANGEADK